MAFLLAGLFAFAATASITLEQGDRVVLVGDTLIERAQVTGEFETELLRRFPDVKLTVRNLGWSGDTPAGRSRCYFDPPSVGFDRLVEQIKATRPTVLIVGYGLAHALDVGNADAFIGELDRLLSAVAEPGMRVAILSTIRPNAPNPRTLIALHQELFQTYRERSADYAREKNHTFVDLFEWTQPEWLKADGVTVSEVGYRSMAGPLVDALFEGASQRQTRVDFSTARVNDRPAVDTLRETGEVRLDIPAQVIGRMDLIQGLPKGIYRVEIGDGPFDQPLLTSAGGREIRWFLPTDVPAGSADPLRSLVIRKNSLYFQRYRPQNITYLLGFRAHEQGQNAKEIEQLDPMIAELESRIEQHRSPTMVHATVYTRTQ